MVQHKTEGYDPESNLWVRKKRLNNPKEILCCCCFLPGRLHMFNAASIWATSPLDPFWCTSVENENYLKQQLIFFFVGYHCTASLTEQVPTLK